MIWIKFSRISKVIWKTESTGSRNSSAPNILKKKNIVHVSMIILIKYILSLLCICYLNLWIIWCFCNLSLYMYIFICTCILLTIAYLWLISFYRVIQNTPSPVFISNDQSKTMIILKITSIKITFLHYISVQKLVFGKIWNKAIINV